MNSWRDTLQKLNRQILVLEQESLLRDKELCFLREIDAVLAYSPISLDKVYQKIIDGALQFTHGASGQLLIPCGSKLKIVYTSENRITPGQSVEIHNSVTGRAYLKRRLQNVGDIRKDKNYQEFMQNMRSEIAVPLLDNKIPMGIINLESHKLRAFRRHDEEVLTTLAGQAVVAILIASLQEQLTLLFGALTHGTSPGGYINNALNTIVDKAKELTNADGCQLLLIKNNELLIRSSTNDKDVGRRFSLLNSISGSAVKSKKPIILKDVSKDKRYLAILKDMCSELAVPVIASNQVLAWIPTLVY